MNKIAVIVLSTISAGELTIAYEFVSRLSKDKYEVQFIVSGKFGPYLESKHMDYLKLDENESPQVNNSKICSFIDSFNPDFFLVSDVFTLEYSYAWSGVKFETLSKYNIPIIGVDEYEFPSTEYKIDYYGLFQEKLPPLVDKCDFIIRDCPINAENHSAENVKCFSLYEKKFELNKHAKQRIRKELGLDDDEKIIFFTMSSWELLNMHKLGSLNSFIKWIPCIIENYISSLQKKVTVIHVGKNPWQNISNNKIRYYHFDSLLPKNFDAYLFASDLYITLNVVSVTLTKAVYAGVPSVVLQNKKIIKFDKLKNRLATMPLWYRNMADDVKVVYPFRASTFGWYKFLDPVLQNNEYTNTFIEVPIFKMSQVVSVLDKYLFDKSAILELKERQMNYVDKILKLSTPNEIMNDIIKIISM